MSRRRRTLLVAVLSLLLAVPLSCAGAVWLNTSPDTVLLELRQPPTPDYQSFGPYSVYVLEGPREWATLEWPRRHRLFVGRSGLGTPDYGRWLDYSFHTGGTDVNEHIQKSTAEWTPEGVTFVEATGHRLFIPKEMFVGGR
jgi:hypothetical protein